MLITERKGTIIHLKADGSRASIKLPRPAPKGEGGLLGIVLHPDFKQNRYLYIYMTTAEGSTGTKNAVFRYVFSNGLLENEKTIISNIPGALYHDGGRLEFGPDDLLYITTGDSQSPDIAQDLASLGGKILRLTDEGSIPAGNPFNTAVYSYGHRNPQGLAWDTQGNLWSTEHGRSGVTSGYDELNLIKPGGNYGWPTIEGPASKQGMISPVIQSGADDTWAPASLVYLNGKLYFGGLRGESLYEATVANGTASNLKEYFNQEFGRIRTVRVGPDGMLYLTTSNRDGRGTPKAGDDKVIRVNPKLL
jgi:glucose/arabinose dehydrogenase